MLFLRVSDLDNLTIEQRKKNMRCIKSCDTEIELKLRKTLWHHGYRYRKNYKLLPGKPDIAITKYKLAIFCDSEFFHGKDWDELQKRLRRSNNSEYWINKISTNIERDIRVERELNTLGWKVVRFWGKDIKNNIDECIKVIDEMVFDIIIENTL